MIVGPPPLQRQRAFDARASVWVAASAGTGKTKVLTDRVLALMLSGSAPHRILCLAFTKAAAAEMANRVHDRLGRWTTEAEGALAGELQALLGASPDRSLIDQARRLFARVLDSPGGLKIETIHAFCQSLLRRFPVEAGVAPHFEVIDERDAGELLVAVREEVLAGARRSADEVLGAAVTRITRLVREQRFSELLDRIAAARSRFQRLVAAPGDAEQAAQLLAERLGVPRDATEARVIAEACAEGSFEAAALRRVAAAMAQSRSAAERKSGGCILAWLESGTERAQRFNAYLAAYFTQEGERRKKLVSKAIAAQVADADLVLSREAERLDRARRLCAAAGLLEATTSVIRLALAVLHAYERHKWSRAILDYDDLIARTVALLERPGVAPWVLYKLDGGLDHLLIDEAQDTNPEQWRIVRALTEEFFAGAGARDLARTVFAVGDAKQSIYSFQGADPIAFLAMRSHFAERAAAAASALYRVTLETSFRSAEAVLAAVDAVFARPEARDGVALDGQPIRHWAHRRGHAGRAEVWPLVEPAATDEPEDWALPVEQKPATDPRVRLARIIAATVRRWLDSGERLTARDRRIRPGDIMVLVRQRGVFVGALVRALKDLDVAVAGVDRMRLAEQLAVEDMIALGQFLLLPEDDLTLASVLKGPLFGFDEEALFALAHGRGGRSLWNELRRRAGERPQFAIAADRLAGLLARADFTPPYELFAEVLGALGGRRMVLQRLGPEAADPLDEFLAAALAYEEDHGPSLQGFLQWLLVGETEIKRDLDQGLRDEVRVLTVHGAKGLEAPIVFLPDTTQVPERVDPLQWTEDGLPLWPVTADTQVAAAATARQAALCSQGEEYRRLLYVALTRAEDRLYVCGWRLARPVPSGSWYELVRQGLTAAPGVHSEPMDFTSLAPEEGWAGDGLVLTGAQSVPPKDDRAPFSLAPRDAILPPWAFTTPRPEPTPPKPLAPSRPATVEPAVRSPLGSDRQDAFRRGRLIHRLLQSLPDLPPDRRRDAAARFLALPIHGLAPVDCESIAAETLAVLKHPDFAALFAPGSRAEVPVVGLIGNRALAGRIDRLVITEDAVLIIDYKTLRPAPASESEVPALYLDQLAAYSTAIGAIYPGKAVRAALLWTEGPRLMPISPAMLAGRSP